MLREISEFAYLRCMLRISMVHRERILILHDSPGYSL